jgi:hypothetical protein
MMDTGTGYGTLVISVGDSGHFGADPDLDPWIPPD